MSVVLLLSDDKYILFKGTRAACSNYDNVTTRLHDLHDLPFVRAILQSHMAIVWYFYPAQAVEQTVGLQMISDAMTSI